MGPVLPLYFASLGFPAIDIGVLFSVWGVGTLVFEPTMGVLADRGRRDVMMYAVCAAGCALYLVYSLANSFLAFALFQFLLGGLFATAAVLYRYVIPSVVSPTRPSAAYGLLGSMYSGAAALGSVAGGLLISATGFRSPFYFAAFFAGISIVPLWASKVGGKAAYEAEEMGAGHPAGKGRTLELALMGCMAVAAFIVFIVVTSMMPVVVTNAPFKASPVDVGILLAIFDGGLFIFLPLLGHVGSSKPRNWMVVGLAVGVISFALLVVTKSIESAYVSALLAGISFSALSTLSLARFTQLVHSSHRGAAIGIYGAAEDVGIIIGPLVFSAVWTAVSLDAALIATATILLVVLFVYLVPRSSGPWSSVPAELARTG